MKYSRRFKLVVLVLMTFGLVMPASVVQAENSDSSEPVARQKTVEIKDVALDADGTFRGQVVDTRGSGMSQKAVEIHFLDQLVARTTTDQEGYFAISGLSGGTYQVSVAAETVMYRFWASQTAPPAVSNAALIVSPEDIRRGQFGGYASNFGKPVTGFLSGNAVAAMTVIPVLVAGGVVIAKNKPVRFSEDPVIPAAAAVIQVVPQNPQPAS